MLPDFSNPNVQYDTLLFILTALGGMFSMKVPRIAIVVNKILGFVKMFQPRPMPAVSAAMTPVPNAATDDEVIAGQTENLTSLPVDRSTAVSMCNDLSNFFLEAKNPQGLELCNTLYNLLHKIPAVEAE